MASVAAMISDGRGRPDPDSEVPQAIRDEIFNAMKRSASERVCSTRQLCCRPVVELRCTKHVLAGHRPCAS